MKSLWDTPGVASWIDSFWDGAGIEEFRQEVGDWVGLQEGRFLDLGCGTGRMARFFPDVRYVGVDGSEEMLDLAKDRVPVKSLRLADVTEPLPLKSKTFSAALCMEVIRHLASYDTVLRELERLVNDRIYIVDAFDDGWESKFSTGEAGGETFPDNRWSLPQLLDDISQIFPSSSVDVHTFSNGSTGIHIEIA